MKRHVMNEYEDVKYGGVMAVESCPKLLMYR